MEEDRQLEQIMIDLYSLDKVLEVLVHGILYPGFTVEHMVCSLELIQKQVKEIHTKVEELFNRDETGHTVQVNDNEKF